MNTVTEWTKADPGKIQKGDMFTIQGRYRRRTLLQWLLRRPKQLQQYTVTMDVPSDFPTIHYRPAR